MSKLTADNKDLAAKIKNKEKGYKFMNIDKIISEYNDWYFKQYPGKFKSVFDGVTEGKEKMSDEVTEEIKKKIIIKKIIQLPIRNL